MRFPLLKKSKPADVNLALIGSILLVIVSLFWAEHSIADDALRGKTDRISRAKIDTVAQRVNNKAKPSSLRSKGGVNSRGQFYFVSSASEIDDLPNLNPGDTVVMTNGTWTNQEIEFAAIGTENAPITLRAETPGLVVLNGDSTLEISGDWLVVDGLRFDGGELSSGHIVQFRGPLGHATNSRFTNSSILNYNPPDLDTRYFWVSVYGQYNRVDNNYFDNHGHSGVTVVVWRDSSAPDFHTIDGNHFTDRPEGTGNGFETIRIGTSTESDSNSFSVIENNLFERVDGEIEIISNKCGGNIFRHNTFRESAGTLTLRHGDGNLVDGNFFLGFDKDASGGVRVIGENQIIVNNYFSGLDGRADGAIAITAGVKGSALNEYFQVKNAVIAHNTIVDVNDAAIVFSQGLGSSDRTLLAEDVIIANNAIYSDQDPLFEGNEGSNWRWHGNIAFGQSLGPANGNPGIAVVDPLFQLDGSLTWRPQEKSPLIDASMGDYSRLARFDMDGQERVDEFDIGADETSSGISTRVPLTGVNVGPPLTILLSQESVDESDGKEAATATVVRNKNSSGALTVTITNSDTSEILTPASVTIPANQSSADFDITAMDDSLKDGPQTLTITVEAEGYPEGIVTLMVNDDD